MPPERGISMATRIPDEPTSPLHHGDLVAIAEAVDALNEAIGNSDVVVTEADLRVYDKHATVLYGRITYNDQDGFVFQGVAR